MNRSTSMLLVLVALYVCRLPAEEPAGTLGMSGAWALYPMAVRWAEAYQQLHPGVRIDVSAGGAGKGMTDVLTGAVDIGLVSRDVNPAEREKGALPVAMVKDAVVAVVNAKNPALAELRKRGVKRDALAGLWVRRDVTTWGQVAGTDLAAPVRLFTRSDSCGAAETWAQYLGGKRQADLKGIGVYGDPGIGETVRRDALAIGYNNVNFAYDARTGKPVEGLMVLPLDVDANGALDKEEDFYATRADLLAAIAEGRYPSPPARDLYFVLRGRPEKPVLAAFLRWALTDGQALVEEAGFVRLPEETLRKGLAAVTGAQVP